jgi:hypothetical protein
MMAHASIHHETAYAIFMKSIFFLRVLNGSALAQVIIMRWIAKIRCTTVDLQSVHTTSIKNSMNLYTHLCTVGTNTVYAEKLISFRRFCHAAASFKARKQHILEFPYFKVIRQPTVRHVRGRLHTEPSEGWNPFQRPDGSP